MMYLSSPLTLEYIHLFVEAFKLAYADRAQYMADEAFTDVPLVGLTKDYAKERAKLIDLEKANEYEYGDLHCLKAAILLITP